MPGKEVLPDALKALAQMNAREVNEPGWDGDVERLIKDLELIFYSPWSKIGGIAFLVILLGALSALSIFIYKKCCTDNTNTTTNSTPSPSSSPVIVAVASPSPSPTIKTPSPTPSVSPSTTPSPTPSPVHPLKGQAWIYETLDSSGKPSYGTVISFDPIDSYIFRCMNKDSYPHKCLHENWLPSDFQSHERKWYLDGNKVTIFWNKATTAEEKDEGVVESDGKRMSGRRIRKGEATIYWIATRMN